MIRLVGVCRAELQHTAFGTFKINSIEIGVIVSNPCRDFLSLNVSHAFNDVSQN